MRRLRAARGFSQDQLSEAIGASQRMIAYYETHAEKAPARHLTALAQVLRVSVDELSGYQPVETPAGRANPRLWRRLRQVEALPPQDRKQVLQLIDTLVERETLRSGRPRAAKKETPRRRRPEAQDPGPASQRAAVGRVGFSRRASGEGRRRRRRRAKRGRAR